MKLLKIIFAVALFAISAPLITACDNNDGAFEEIGEEIDEVGEEIVDEIDDATDER